MLYEFIDRHREDIVARTTARLRDRPAPLHPDGEREHGVARFLTQVCETLRLEATAVPFSCDAIGATAARHGAELLGAGFNVSQVVHDYGDICQAITEVALEHHAPISVAEFHTLNRCLDTAIAEAVTEHSRLVAQSRSDEEVERVGQEAHELRDLLNGALLAFHALKRGTVPINGSTGAVLGRSLTSLAALVDRSLSEVRLAASQQRRDRIKVAIFVGDLTETALLHAEYRGVRFTVTPVDAELTIEADPQVLASAVMNLLLNAFKNTRAGGGAVLRVWAKNDRLIIEVEDECGGIPDSKSDLFQAFGDRRGTDRSGLGLGLSMARRAVRAHRGDITVVNRPGLGCVFAINLPLVTAAEPQPVPIAT